MPCALVLGVGITLKVGVRLLVALLFNFIWWYSLRPVVLFTRKQHRHQTDSPLGAHQTPGCLFFAAPPCWVVFRGKRGESKRNIIILGGPPTQDTPTFPCSLKETKAGSAPFGAYLLILVPLHSIWILSFFWGWFSSLKMIIFPPPSSPPHATTVTLFGGGFEAKPTTSIRAH